MSVVTLSIDCRLGCEYMYNNDRMDEMMHKVNNIPTKLFHPLSHTKKESVLNSTNYDISLLLMMHNNRALYC